MEPDTAEASRAAVEEGTLEISKVYKDMGQRLRDFSEIGNSQ